MCWCKWTLRKFFTMYTLHGHWSSWPEWWWDTTVRSRRYLFLLIPAMPSQLDWSDTVAKCLMHLKDPGLNPTSCFPGKVITSPWESWKGLEVILLFAIHILYVNENLFFLIRFLWFIKFATSCAQKVFIQKLHLTLCTASFVQNMIFIAELPWSSTIVD